MDALLHILDSYGYLLVFALCFAEYVGVPIASVPVLIAAGALARAGGLNLPLIVCSAALGGLSADALWYTLARWKGCRLVGAACGLSSNRKACVSSVADRVKRMGIPYVLTAKFIPGAGNLIASAAGLGRLPARRFLALDAVGLIAWAMVYAGAGWLFSDRVGSVIDGAMAYSRWILWILLPLIILGVMWRYIKIRGHRSAHAGNVPNRRTEAAASLRIRVRGPSDPSYQE